jgi:RNA polymerase sigma-70 factor (ECF subfamily)
MRMSGRGALAFPMREVTGLSAEEICGGIGITTANLHVILFRARLSLRSGVSKSRFGREHE